MRNDETRGYTELRGMHVHQPVQTSMLGLSSTALLNRLAILNPQSVSHGVSTPSRGLGHQKRQEACWVKVGVDMCWTMDKDKQGDGRTSTAASTLVVAKLTIEVPEAQNSRDAR